MAKHAEIAVEGWTAPEIGAHSAESPDHGKLDSATARRKGVSLLRYSPGLVLVLIVVADSIRYADPDLWGHIRFGQAILASHRLTRSDPYSYSAAGSLWRNHEWLAQVVMALVYDAFGVPGLKLMKFAFSAATIALMSLAVSETGVAPAVQLVVMTVAALALAPQMQFRPQLFTFVFLATLMALLARDNYRRRAPLWWLIPMFALWVNLHGGFVIGIGVLATYSALRISEDWFTGQGFERSRHLVPITIGATLATLATPYGFAAWVTVEDTLRNPFTRTVVTEWRPLIASMGLAWYHAQAAMIFFACVLGLFAALAVFIAKVPSADDLPMVVVAALMAVGVLLSVRNMVLFVIAAAAPLARHAGAARLAREASAEQRVYRDKAGERSAVHPMFALVVAVILSAYTGLFSKRLQGSVEYPGGAVAFMASRNLGGNLLCDFNWGEYLIWHTAPESRVFIDGRYQLVYPAPVIEDYLKFYFDKPGAGEVLAKYAHDFVLIPPRSGGYRVVSDNPAWKLIYEDPVAALFARANSSTSRLSGIPTHGSAKPSLFP